MNGTLFYDYSYICIMLIMYNVLDNADRLFYPEYHINILENLSNFMVHKVYILCFAD